MKALFRLSAAVVAVLLAGASVTAQEPSCTGPEGAARLYVDVEGVHRAEGLIAVTLYADDSKRFLAKRGALYVGRVPAQTPRTSVCIYLPKTGTYGIAVYHDADADQKFDRNGIGLPDEGYGFSNNPAVIFGLPSFRSVRLAVPTSGMRTRVRLRYL
jgi:uncharacterized protein (DUF2141 family)